MGPVADAQDDVKGDAPMKIPALHGERDEKAAEQEEHHGVGEGRRGVIQVGDAEQRQKEERQERGGEQRDRFGRPPDRHPHTECSGGPARR